jgi:hypothetical protein
MPLYYSDNNKSELDFVIEEGDGIAILEVKKSDGQSKSAKTLIEGKSNRHADRCYKVRDKNYGKGSYFDGIPHNALSFLLESIRKKTEATLRVETLKL